MTYINIDCRRDQRPESCIELRRTPEEKVTGAFPNFPEIAQRIDLNNRDEEKLLRNNRIRFTMENFNAS